MPAALGGRDRDRGVAAGRQHEDGVEAVGEHVLPGGVAGRLREERSRVRERRRRDVAEGRDLEPVAELAQVRQVHHLGDETTADDADAKTHGGTFQDRERTTAASPESSPLTRRRRGESVAELERST